MLLVIVLVNGLPDCAVILSPVVLRLFAAIHEKVEVLLPVNTMLTVPPLQMVTLVGLVIVGLGFTVTLTVCGVPAQPLGFDVGVIV